MKMEFCTHNKLFKEKYFSWHRGEKIRVVFMFQAATIWASWESLYKACLKDEDIDARVVLVKHTANEKAHMIGAECFLQEQGINYAQYEEFNIFRYEPHVVFVQFPYDLSCHDPLILTYNFKKNGIRVVYIPYGLEIVSGQAAWRSHFENYVVENCWRVFTGYEQIYGEYRKYCRNRSAVRAAGSPKFDGIAYRDNYPLNESIIKKANGRRIVLWKMHFPKKFLVQGNVVQSTPELEEYIKFAKVMEKYHELFFVILPHPIMLSGMIEAERMGDITLEERVDTLLMIIRSTENTFIDVSADYRNSLYHADAIIIDRSATMIEAAMLKVPVLFMTGEDYQEEWSIGVKQVVDTFIQGSTAKDIERFVNSIISEDSSIYDKVMETSQVVEHFFPYRDGLCGFRIKECLKQDIRNESVQQTEPIRLALYGAGEVCAFYLKEGFDRAGLNKTTYEIVLLCDGNEKRWGEEFYGLILLAPEKLLEDNYDIVIIMSEPNDYDIRKYLIYDLRIDGRKIWRLDEFLTAAREIKLTN